MHLQINPHDLAPVYRQIQHQITRAIVDRELQPGQLLESQQELAVQLAVSPSSVRKAYGQLQSDGLCDLSHGGRFRVTTPDLGSDHRTRIALSLLRRELLTQELRSARAVQHRFLPASEIQGASWAISGRSFPASALAGDFYDLIQLDNGDVEVVIADVAGKGLAAGLIMAATKGLLPMAAGQDSPGLALEELNRRLIPLLSNRDFVALALVRFRPQDGSVTFANAGLPDLYLLHHAGPVETLEVTGDRLPLGIREDVQYSTSQYQLQSADRLLLVTDGIPEALDPLGEPLGYERFARLLESSTERSDDDGPNTRARWLDRLLDQASQRTGSLLDDDWTAVLLEYRQP